MARSTTIRTPLGTAAPATRTSRTLRPAIAGVAAAAVAMAASELVAGLVAGAPSLIVALGGQVIALQPPGAKELAVTLFGLNDKLALEVGVVIGGAVVAAIAGILADRRFWLGAAVFVAFGIVAAGVAASQPLTAAPLAVATAGLAVAAGLITLATLLGYRPAWRSTTVESADTGAMPDWTRRRFLIASAGTIGVAVVAGGVGRTLLDARHSDGIVVTSRLPDPLRAVPPLAADQSLAVPGITPLVVPPSDFYRIDTALLVPRVDAETWRLRVDGMVDRPLELGYDELLEFPLIEQYVTIACVSNRIGGNLVGNALWTGVRLKDVLEVAGVQDGATQIVGRSVDDFTAGFPTDWALADGREPMIAVGMDRQPLPAEHGFPARLIVPGLYGYVSATKWLSSIELTTREAVDGYWIPLGWAKDAPILTQSRIDVPATGATIPAGPVEVAGVAWAPDRGITGVEVRVDEGAWAPARHSVPISDATWVQWAWPWTATAGRHMIEVRATDGTGEVQTDERTDPAPDGARGHHRISVTVV
jgi:DMSO/TMAO reductase YedYZ molybdopterin-dependent catalytic subunit